MKISATVDVFDESGRSIPQWLQSLARKAVLAKLQNLKHGIVILHEGKETLSFGQHSEECALTAHVQVHDASMYFRILLNGNIGAGEGYMLGLWSSRQLTELLRIFVVNREALLDMEKGVSHIGLFALKLWHLARRNTKVGSRQNIQSHYDIGNEFYSLFLDTEKMYSSAVYPSTNCELEAAARFKLEMICDKLDLQPSDHLLEIGTGWGGLAIYAAKHYGCKVTTTTISKEQFEYARRRITEEGLDDKVMLLMKDYRELTGQYDKLVSVEMIEAVGHQYYSVFFKKCSRLLKANGLALIQSITIKDQYYERAKKSVDFIQRYIFPGGGLPAVYVIMNQITKNTDMRLLHQFDFAEDYAKTLNEWRARFFDQLEQVRSLGYSARFIRMWEYYLCYCEAGFLERSIGVSQFVFAKPKNRQKTIIECSS